MSTQKPRIVSLFSGAGCFDLGFEEAGFEVITTIDQDKDCCETLKLNIKGNVLNSPIELITSTKLLQISNLYKRKLELLIGGPPCQPFSKCAYGVLGTPLGLADERANTINEYFRILEALLPKAFVLENVPQFISGKNEHISDFIKSKIASINNRNNTAYKLSFCKINTAWFGVPQLRERIFIIGSIDGYDFEMPSTRFSVVSKLENNIHSYRTTWDAIGHLSNTYDEDLSLKVGGKWGYLLESIPPGNNYNWHTNRGGGEKLFEWRSRYFNFLLKLSPLLPSWTIAAQPGTNTGPFHWNNRKLSTKELQLLQTIPEYYKFVGSLSSIRRQIGNGVPSAIGELIGKELRSQFFGERVFSSDSKLIPSRKLIPTEIRDIFQ